MTKKLIKKLLDLGLAHLSTFRSTETILTATKSGLWPSFLNTVLITSYKVWALAIFSNANIKKNTTSKVSVVRY